LKSTAKFSGALHRLIMAMALIFGLNKGFLEKKSTSP